MSKLYIYKASAGSGKTYRLTGEYLKLIIANPLIYRNVLAVTFTNKAASEMKGRIIKELYRLACGDKSSYTEELLKIPLCSNDEETLHKQAAIALNNILHDYSRFSVFTIDSFFQRVLRGFLRELGMQAGFTLEMDTDKVLDEVTERVIENAATDEALRNWLIDYVSEQIEEGKSWNIRDDIRKLSNEVTKEYFLTSGDKLRKKIADKKFLCDYLSAMHGIVNGYEQDLKEIVAPLTSILECNGVAIEDFSYGKTGPVGFLHKISLGIISDNQVRARAAVDDPAKWVKKKSPKEKIIYSLVQQSLNTMMKKVLTYLDQHTLVYNSAQLVLTNFYRLGLLSDITMEVDKYQMEENAYMLTETTQLLNRIIADNDPPFIYEKTGNTYSHFMIDEFQDTSKVQWQNFKPLLRNSLGENFNNLVVGDVKQSIYRWRNSDWNILAKEIYTDFLPEQIEDISLTHNWRSSENIIRFNNTFFSRAVTLLAKNAEEEFSDSHLAATITNAYSDVIQQTRVKENIAGGYVNLTYLVEDEATNVQERILQSMLQAICDLRKKNYTLNNIVILVRSHREGKLVTDFLMHYNSMQKDNREKISFVSEDFLRVDSAVSVQCIIQILRCLHDPDDELAAANMVYLLEHTKGNDQLTEIFASCREKRNALLAGMETLLRLNLYDTVEQIINHFQLEEMHEEPFLSSFRDIVLEFMSSEGANLQAFLDWWEENAHKKVLPLSEQQDALRVITIHKSKGMEFDAVILPFASWAMAAQSRLVLWVSPKEKPFDELPLLPVIMKKKLQQSIFAADYASEQCRSFIDNMNLLYVAFTRAKYALYVIMPDTKMKNVETADTLIRKTILTTDTDENGLLNLKKYYDEEKKIFEYGLLEEINKDVSPVFASEMLHKESFAHTQMPELRINKYAGKYSSASAPEWQQKRHYGKIMHDLFRQIKTMDDVPVVLQQMISDGILPVTEKNTMERYIQKLLSQSKVQGWFDDRAKILTERDILVGENKILRPDRVVIRSNAAEVIDYKFGDAESIAHVNQVKKYCEYLKKMGYHPVKGYLWYAMSDMIKEVPLD